MIGCELFTAKSIVRNARRSTGLAPTRLTLNQYRLCDPPERFLNITRGLVARGYKTTEIEKILGGNWVRYFAELLP